MKVIPNPERVIGSSKNPLMGAPADWQPARPNDQPEHLVELSLARILKNVVYSAKAETMHDSRMGNKCLDALDAADGHIELEDEWYSWLKGKAETTLPPLWGPNAHIIFELLCENGQTETRATRRRRKG